MTSTTPAPTTRSRLSPEERRTQLLEMGVRLFSEHAIEDFSIDLLAEQAGVSRGLLYHYFGGKQEYYEAVVQYAADDLYRRTAPPETGETLDRLLGSIDGFVDYVVANEAAYRALVRSAAGGNETVRAIYDTTFTALGDRFFTAGVTGLVDDAVTRLVIRGWQAFAEEVVLGWCDDKSLLSREELTALVVNALPAILTNDRMQA